MPNVRMFPPPSNNWPPAFLSRVENSRPGGATYSTTVGVPLDVPEADVQFLEGQGWTAIGRGGHRGSAWPAYVGPTSERPTQAGPAQPLYAGTQYIDTTLGAMIIWDGTTWRDIEGTAV